MRRLLMYQIAHLKGGTEKKNQPMQGLERFIAFQSSA